MEIELVPEPDATDPALRAAAAAITTSGLADEAQSVGSLSSWRRIGVQEAVDRDVAPGTASARGAPMSGHDSGAAPRAAGRASDRPSVELPAA